jgi:hypothetical protein
LELVGSNVTITPDATNDKVTIGITKSNVTTALGYTPPTTDTKYTHPTTSGNKHIPSGGSSGQILRWSADGTAVWGNDNNTTYSAATSSTAGLMSAADKAKLDGIATGANKTTVDSALSSTSTNPVQNKIIKAALDKCGSVDIDLDDIDTGKATSINADTLGGVKADEYIKKSDAMAVTKNYSVIGGMTEPVNKTENMIWVQTETEKIGKVYFSGIEPSNCADNDIWIYTNSNSSVVAFDSIRIGNDTMQTIYPIYGKQYIGGAWVDKTAKSYQGGAWVDWILDINVLKKGVNTASNWSGGSYQSDGTMKFTRPTSSYSYT